MNWQIDRYTYLTKFNLYRGPQHDMNAWEYNMNKNDLIDIDEKCEKTLKEFGYMMPWFYSIDNTHTLVLGIASCVKFLLPLMYFLKFL